LANASWPKLVEEFLKAQHDTDELRVFVNTILAEGWRDAGEEVDEAALQTCGEPFSLDAIPEEVLLLTAGADVQDDRLEVSIVGWTRGDDALILEHLPIWGSPDDNSTWAAFDALLRTRWRHPWGGQLGVDGCVVDSGAWTDKVYGFCFPRLGRRIFAGKGVPGHHPAFAPSRGKVRGGRLFLIGVDTLKTTIISRLARGQSIRFAGHLENEYFAQLASERKVVRYSRGQPRIRFERKPGARAEALDCLCYAFAARHATRVQLE
jgi:phage terminase large subunit GpA-like protein